MQELGTIQTVDLREVWPREAADFTPWLAMHLSELGNALGIELELQSEEAPVGSFSLDLLAHDLGKDRPVTIENQLESTNHDHLGKLLTYAAGYDAGVVIWVAKEFRDEHRQVLDWLNQNTSGNIEFFGVVVEAIRIDNSRPAPNFKLVAFPNEWRKTKVGGTTSEDGVVSERYQAYQSFFQEIVDHLRDDHKFTNARKAQPKSWCAFSTGYSGIRYGVSFAQGGQARVELYIDRDRDWNKELFDTLKQDEIALKADLQEILEWERLDNRRACRISAVQPGTIEDEEEALENLQEWMIAGLLKFKTVFGARLAQLVK